MSVKEFFLLCCFFIALKTAQANVCTRTDAVTTLTAYYVQRSIAYTTSCGFLGWSTCDRVRYGTSLNYRTDTRYVVGMECCYGYHDPLGGLDCQPYCEDCDSNHICSEPFTCVCPEGWTGDDCSEPYCEDCDSNHTCSAPFTCVCPEGWTGNDCSEPYCEDCDSNHTCSAPFTCVCPEGWTGDDCSLDIDECTDGTSGCEQICNNTVGSYMCVCNTTYNLALDLHSCLGLPENVTLNSSSSRSLLLKWDPPKLDVWDSSITSYEVKCNSSFNYSYHVIIDGGLTEYNVPDLSPFSTYSCCVGAITTNGGTQSACDTADTLQDKPGDIPQFITVNNHSAYAILIEWQPPDIPNGIITLYTIYIDYNNGTSGMFIITEPTPYSFKLPGLSPHQLIGVSISASTIVGEGPVSFIISERTSQAVPSEVTHYNIAALSPNELLVSWNLPEYLNGILIGYRIVAYNAVYNYSFSVFLPETETQFNLTNNIERYVPYTIEVSAFTQAGEGIAMKIIAFSEEGVPAVLLNVSSLNRTDPTSFEIHWIPPTLEELRGFLVSYIVVFEELSTYQCPNLNLKMGHLTEHDPSYKAIGLNPAREYCVEIAAETSAGFSNSTKFIIPFYTYLLFQLHFTGVYNCPEWVNKESLEKIEDFIQQISIEISKTCECHIPVEHFAEERLICEPSRSDKVVFQSKLVITEDKGTDEIMSTIDLWTTMKPHIVVQGVQLNVDYNCSVELDELGNGECISTTTPGTTTPDSSSSETVSSPTEFQNNTSKEEQSSQSQSIDISPIAIGVSVGVLFIAIIIVAVSVGCIAVRHTKQRKKQNDTHGIQMDPQGGHLINEMENPLYTAPTKRATGGLPSYDQLEEETKELYPE